MYFKIAAAALALTFGIGYALAADSPAGGRAYFINLQNGAHVKSPVLIQFGLAGMGVAPAGSTNANTGHHHLIIDSDTPPAGMPIPMDERHRHFGGGQTEVSLQLPPGTHTVQLVLADGAHVPHNPPVMSQRITVTVDP